MRTTTPSFFIWLVELHSFGQPAQPLSCWSMVWFLITKIEPYEIKWWSPCAFLPFASRLEPNKLLFSVSCLTDIIIVFDESGTQHVKFNQLEHYNAPFRQTRHIIVPSKKIFHFYFLPRTHPKRIKGCLKSYKDHLLHFHITAWQVFILQERLGGCNLELYVGILLTCFLPDMLLSKTQV